MNASNKVLIALIIVGTFTVAYLLGMVVTINKNMGELPSPDPVPSTIQPEATPKPTTKSDPIVSCTSSVTECKGQSIVARRSECSKVVCCGLLYGVHELFSDITKCNLEQRIELDATRIHLNVPQYQPPPVLPLQYYNTNTINLRP
jgi:hypothetical protein